MENEEIENWWCSIRSREAKICPKCKPVRKGDFTKVFDLAKTGICVYFHHDGSTGEKENKNTTGKKPGTFLVYNTNITPIERSEYIKELNNLTTQCRKCNSILQQIRVSLDKSHGMRKSELVGTCDHCKWVPGPIRCKRCANIINKFLLKRIKHYKEQHETFHDWLGNVKELVSTVAEKETAKKKHEHASFEELKELLQEMRISTTLRVPEILNFPASDIENKDDEAFAKNKVLLEKIVSNLQSETPTMRQNLEKILGEKFIREMPEEILRGLGRVTKEKLAEFLGLKLTNEMIDKLLDNLGKLSQENINKSLGPKLYQAMLEKLMLNLDNLTKDKADKVFGIDLTRELIDKILINIGGDTLTKSKIEEIFGSDIPKEIIDQILFKFKNATLTGRGLQKALGNDVSVYQLFDKILTNFGKLAKNKLEAITGANFSNEVISKLIGTIGKVNLGKCEKLFGTSLTNIIVDSILNNFGENFSKEKLDNIIGSDLSDEIIEKIMAGLCREELTRAKLERIFGPNRGKDVLNKILAKLVEQKLAKQSFEQLLGSFVSKELQEKILTSLDRKKITVQALEKLLGSELATLIIDKFMANLGKKYLLDEKFENAESDIFFPPMKSSLKGSRKRNNDAKLKIEEESSFTLLPPQGSTPPQQRLSIQRNVTFGESQMPTVAKKTVAEDKQKETVNVHTANITKKPEDKLLKTSSDIWAANNEHVMVNKIVSKISPKEKKEPKKNIKDNVTKEAKQKQGRKPQELENIPENLIRKSERKDAKPKPKKIKSLIETPKPLSAPTLTNRVDVKYSESKLQSGKSTKNLQNLPDMSKMAHTDPTRHIIQLSQSKRDDFINIQNTMPSAIEDTGKQVTKEGKELKLLGIDVDGMEESKKVLKTNGRERRLIALEKRKEKSSQHIRRDTIKSERDMNNEDGSSQKKPKMKQQEISDLRTSKKKRIKEPKSIQLSVSTNELLKMIKLRETERKTIMESRIKKKNNFKQMSIELPRIDPKIKNKPDLQDMTDKEGESTIDCDSGVEEIQEMVKGVEVIPFHKDKEEIQPTEVPLLFKTMAVCPPPVIPKDDEVEEEHSKVSLSNIMQNMQSDNLKGVIKYDLSNPEFIKKGWTKLPTTRVMRKLDIYKMKPAKKKSDWFGKHREAGIFFYESGEKLAEIDADGFGRWYYKNGRVALDYYRAKEPLADSRYVVYSSGERDEGGTPRPVTVLACFDRIGNGIVLDHHGNQRLKYNQSEGVVIDEKIGPPSKWQWHNLNEPPVIKTVYMDSFPKRRNSQIEKLMEKASLAACESTVIKAAATTKKTLTLTPKSQEENETVKQIAYEQMLSLELENFAKQRRKKLFQKFKTFEIKAKFLKINEHFSLKIIDQANIGLQFRDGLTVLKQNLGMNLINTEIIDIQAVDVGDVTSPFDRTPSKSQSIDKLNEIIQIARLKSNKYKSKSF